ncbi:regucalcin isoform X2 [Leptinotarsa decemlineata]|uniref:regucalcin isoform X2 n=1 Tax=Leptinotarsa decemlineata TaxID=7539 RepID=UPI003D30C24C
MSCSSNIIQTRIQQPHFSKALSITPITPAVTHSEGPYWDEKEQTLYYLDTFSATLHRWDSQIEQLSSHKLENHNSVGLIVPIKGEKNSFLVGADRDLFKLSWPTGLSKVKRDVLLKVEADKPKNQFNDGKIDSKGRVWIGTLTREDDLSVSPKGGTLYMIKCGEIRKEEEKILNTSISNGIAWSKDNTKFYFTDSMEKTVAEYDYEEESGEISNRRIIFDLHNHSDLEGIPDGMTIDINGNLWIALFGGHAVINVDPRTGQIVNRIKMPVKYVTSVCFGGPQFADLFVTTSRLHLKENQLPKEPDAGCVFVVKNLGIRGLPGNEVIFYS